MLQEVMTSPGVIEFLDVPIPEIRDDQVLVKMMRLGICGSDIHVYHGKHPYTKYPVTQGHEVSGEIVQVGSAVKGLEVGQKVVLEPQVTCGKCYPCTHGKYNLCTELKVMGFQTTGAANKMWPNIGTLPIPVVILIAVGLGALIGAFNGFFVAKFKLHPFIVTLATQLIIYTLLLLYVKAGENNGMAISGLDKSYSGFITGSILKIGGTPIPNYVWIAVICTIVMWFIWNKTTFGKNMFALGANEEAARVSGVNVFATNIMVFALAGAMYAVTGFIEGARVASNTANTGLNYESDAIAACVIGGVSFVGGIGKIRGIVIGVLMLRLIFVGLNMIGINQDLFYIIKGGIILFACALDMRKYLVKK